MRSYDDLVAEAQAADVDGWGFGWLEGRATEERPGWRYSSLLADRLAEVDAALDVDTGGGEVVDEAPTLPSTMWVTESWPPNASGARDRLEPRGVNVAQTRAGGPLPFEDNSFDLVTARHPVRPDWPELHRVLRPGGHYFAQHVGPESAVELIERFVDLDRSVPGSRTPEREVAAAQDVGFAVEDLRRARCRMEFSDVGAVVWILRKCVWWVPDFTVDRYDAQLRELDEQMRAGLPFVAHSTRHLMDLRR